MTTVNDDIETALLQSVTDCNIGLPTGRQNLPFPTKPKDGTPWAAVSLLPAGAAPVTMGLEGEDSHGGILQIDLNYPLLSGTGAIRAKADTVASFYTAGKPLVHGNFKGWVSACFASPGREVNGHWKVSMSIVWSGRAPRNT